MILEKTTLGTTVLKTSANIMLLMLMKLTVRVNLQTVTSTSNTENSTEQWHDTGNSVESMTSIFKELTTTNSTLNEDEVEVHCCVQFILFKSYQILTIFNIIQIFEKYR